jgi:MinD-like ATPase involved in chromosome partitioning or flagellar assembly/capsular polysaccharide biosynthesis protein
MDLRELRVILGRYIFVAAAAFYLCVIGGILAAVLPDRMYSTSATVVMEINNDLDTGGGAVQQAAFLLPSIEEKAASRSLKDRVSADVAEEFRTTRVDIAATGQSSVIRIRGESTSPFAAEAWVNAVADRIVEEHPRDSAVVLGVLDRAPLKRRPISPDTEPIIISSIVVGLIVGVFSALAADRLKRAFDTSQTIRERLDTTLLGEVPAMRRFGRERRRPVHSLLNGPNPSTDLVAAFDNIRTNVEFRMTQVGAEKVAIVSLTSGAGKSTVTAGLASSMANVCQVVAIEADLRRPKLSEQLGIRLAFGLGDMAAFGYKDLVLQATDQPNLKVLPAGIPAARPADVITSTLPFAIETLTDSSWRVFIDTPPLLGASESAFIVTEAKWVILVLSSTGNDFAGLTEAIQLVNEAGGQLLGVIVNRVPRRRFRRHSYNIATDRSRQATSGAKAPVIPRLPVQRRETAGSSPAPPYSDPY